MISVIIPVKNGAGFIRECLRGAFNQHALETPYEVIVVDDGSTDETAEIAREMGAQVISQPNAGPAAARNTGAEHARGEILAFTDADCVPAPAWLCHLVQPFSNPEVVGTKGTYRTQQKSLVARFVQQEYESKYIHMARLPKIDFIDTYSAAYRRSVFLQNGGFETAFPVPSVEDQEFSFRLARKGYTMVFTPGAVVYHQHDHNLGEYIRRKYGIGYWKAFMLRWVPEKALSDSHTLASQRWQILLLGLVMLAAGLGFFWPPLGWLALAALGLFYVTSLPALMQISHQDAAVLAIAPLMLLLRAGSQAVGLAAGFILPPASRPRPTAGLTLGARLFKRMLDIAGSLIGLVVSSPLLLLASLMIKLDDGGPIVFTQERAGENGKPFRVYKLRTMVVGAEKRVHEVLAHNHLEGPVFKIPNDPRVTRAGRWLRRWSLDELPQFWNVLKGDMSLVGPRPEETWVVAQYDDRQRQRLAIKPGLTGPMQISGRGELNMDARLELELDYIQHYSIIRDLSILFLSIPAVLSGKGAY